MLPDYTERDHARIPHHKKWRNNEPVYASNYDDEEASQADGYVLYKTLSDGTTRTEQDNGLSRIFGSPRFNKDHPDHSNNIPSSQLQANATQTHSRQWDPTNNTHGMATSPSGYMSLGLRPQYFNNFITHPPSSHPHPFLFQSELSAMNPDHDFPQFSYTSPHGESYSEINADDSVSNVSPAWLHESRPSIRMHRHDHYPPQQTSLQEQEIIQPNSSCSPISPPSSIHKGQVPEVLWQRPPPDHFVNRKITSRSFFGRSLSNNKFVSRKSGIQSFSSPSNQLNQDGNEKSHTDTKVILKPSDNEVTAHLANLMTLHLTISPNTQQGMSNLTFQKSASSVPASVPTSASAVASSTISTPNTGPTNSGSSAFFANSGHSRHSGNSGNSGHSGHSGGGYRIGPLECGGHAIMTSSNPIDESYQYSVSAVSSPSTAGGCSRVSGGGGGSSCGGGSSIVSSGGTRRRRMRRVVKHMFTVPEVLIRD